jgi:hypothetical protein
MKPTPAKPRIIMAQVEGSGTEDAITGVTVPKRKRFSEVIESKFPGCTEPPSVGKSNWKPGQF